MYISIFFSFNFLANKRSISLLSIAICFFLSATHKYSILLPFDCAYLRQTCVQTQIWLVICIFVQVHLTSDLLSCNSNSYINMRTFVCTHTITITIAAVVISHPLFFSISKLICTYIHTYYEYMWKFSFVALFISSSASPTHATMCGTSCSTYNTYIYVLWFLFLSFVLICIRMFCLLFFSCYYWYSNCS